MRICFFARVDEDALTKVGFYVDDIRILRELGHEVVIATAAHRIPWDCDLYVGWWFTSGIAPLAVAKLCGKPSITIGPIHYHDKMFGYRTRALCIRAAIRCTLRYTDAAVVDSKIEYSGAQELGARNLYMIYHGLSTPAEARPRSRRTPVVLSIGHLGRGGVARKGFDNVIRAIPLVTHRVPDARFVFAGTIGSGFYLDKLAASIGVSDRVSFPGRIKNQARDELLQSAMVLAQPSAYEGFGLAQLEAMGAGLPVVTSPVGAVPEVVGDAGLYCNKDSVVDIAAQIISVLEDAIVWNRLSRMGRERATSLFTYEARKVKVQQVIEDVMSSTSRVNRERQNGRAPAMS